MPGWTCRHLRSAPTLTGTSKPSGSGGWRSRGRGREPQVHRAPGSARGQRGQRGRTLEAGGGESSAASLQCPALPPSLLPLCPGHWVCPSPSQLHPAVLGPRFCPAGGRALCPQPQARNSSPPQTSGATLGPGLMGGGVPAPRALTPRRGQLQARCPLARPHSGNRPPHALGHVLRLPQKNGPQRGNFKQQKSTLSQPWRPEPRVWVSAGLRSP